MACPTKSELLNDLKRKVGRPRKDFKVKSSKPLNNSSVYYADGNNELKDQPILSSDEIEIIAMSVNKNKKI